MVLQGNRWTRLRNQGGKGTAAAQDREGEDRRGKVGERGEIVELGGVATLYFPTSAWLISVPVTCTPAIGQNVSSRRIQPFEWQCESKKSLVSRARRLDQVLMRCLGQPHSQQGVLYLPSPIGEIIGLAGRKLFLLAEELQPQVLLPLFVIQAAGIASSMPRVTV